MWDAPSDGTPAYCSTLRRHLSQVCGYTMDYILITARRSTECWKRRFIFHAEGSPTLLAGRTRNNTQDVNAIDIIKILICSTNLQLSPLREEQKQI